MTEDAFLQYNFCLIDIRNAYKKEEVVIGFIEKDRNTGWQMSLKARKCSAYIEVSVGAMLIVILLCVGMLGKIPTEQNRQIEKDSLTQIQNEADLSDPINLTERKSEDKSTAQANPADSSSVTAEMFSPAGKYQIEGKNAVTVEQLISYFIESGEKYPGEELSKGGADSIETFCQMYYDEATAEDIRPEVAFAQAMKETGFLQYGGDASI